MVLKTRILTIASVIALGLAGARAVSEAQQVLNLDQMSKQMPKKEFRAKLKSLPDDAQVESKGQRMTVGEIRAKEKQMLAAAAAKMKASAAQSKTKFEEYAARFNEKQQAKLRADNQKVEAEFARLQQTSGGTTQDSRRATIESEARELSQRYKTASPAEKAQIDKRAGELLRQFER
jgi:hypothetical protein